MKSKLICLMLLLAIVLLTGCSAIDDKYIFDKADTNSLYSYSSFENGAIYRKDDSNLLWYLDFISGKENPLCAKANCSHDNSDCPADLGNFESYFFITGEKLYFLSEMYPLKLIESDYDRTNEKQIAAISGELHYGRTVKYQDSIYIFVTETSDGKDLSFDAHSKLSISVVNLKQGKETALVEISSGYENQIGEIYGIKDGKIYFKNNYYEEPVDYSFDPESELSQDEQIQAILDKALRTTVVFDTKDNSVTKQESAFPSEFDLDTQNKELIYMTDDSCLYVENENAYVYNFKNSTNNLACETKELYFLCYYDNCYYFRDISETAFDTYRYNTESEKTEKINVSDNGYYFNCIVGEYEDYIYMESLYLQDENDFNSSFDVIKTRVKKDDLTKENYTVEVCSK